MCIGNLMKRKSELLVSEKILVNKKYEVKYTSARNLASGKGDIS